jgi:cell division protein FtsB
MAPEINWGWSALNEVAALKLRVAELERRVAQLEASEALAKEAARSGLDVPRATR